jgi:hypothetical protein
MTKEPISFMISLPTQSTAICMANFSNQARGACRRCAGFFLVLVCLLLSIDAPGAELQSKDQPAAGSAGAPAFKRRGFYLHEGWFFQYPFAVRTWQRADFAAMFQLLRRLGFEDVMIWPMLESIPAPLSDGDAAALREFRPTIDDAHQAGLECWITTCPNLAPRPEIAAKPFPQRNPWPFLQSVRLDDPAQAKPYLAHRAAMIAILNNADAYVTIDGDPGGYAGAKPEDWLKVFQSDRAAIDQHGVDPRRQRVVPWVWCGWGTKGVWQEPIEPYIRASLALLAQHLPEPWDLLPGRSHLEGWANGRINLALAEEFGLIPRSTLMCYEAIEFEPTPPASVLQLDHIRRILKQEAKYAATARGVFGNAQQPVMVLPNLYFFARGSKDLAYLDQPDRAVLGDFADLLGGAPGLLVPAWSCLNLGLSELPEDLPKKLRAMRLTGETAQFIPGGPKRYLDILASQVESRVGLLKAIREPAASDDQAARQLADGITALVRWWNQHRYVSDGNGDEPFGWGFVHGSQVNLLRDWCRANVKDLQRVPKQASELLADRQVLPEALALQRIGELLRN